VKVGEEEKGGQAKTVFKKLLLVLFKVTPFKLKIWDFNLDRKLKLQQIVQLFFYHIEVGSKYQNLFSLTPFCQKFKI
jgi:hypothetical protein